MKTKNSTEIYHIIGILLVCLVVILPLLHKGLIVTDDADWMVIRLSAFYQSLRDGQMPVRFLGRLNHGYGYPVANFLYPGFLYLGSFLHLLGFSFVNAVKVIFAASIFGSAIFVYSWLKIYFDRNLSFWGTVNFILSPYILYDLYIRGSVGEILAIFSASLLTYLIAKNFSVVSSLAVGLLILSHNSIALLYLLFIFVFIIVSKKYQYLKWIILGIGLSAFFWFPAIYEKRFVKFDLLAVSDPVKFLVSWENLYLLGLTNLLAAIILFKQSIRFKLNTINKFYLISFGVISLLVTKISYFFWVSNKFAGFIQFPYRLLAVALFPGVWIFTTLLNQHKKKKHIYLLPSLIIWLVIGFNIFSKITYSERPEGYYTTNEATTTVAEEYMPRWVEEPAPARSNKRIEFYKGNGEIEINLVNTKKYDFTINALENSIVQINTIYYPGWGASIDGLPITIDQNNKQGLMQVQVAQGKHHVLVEFRETVPRFLADIVSLVCLVIVVKLLLKIKLIYEK